MFEGDGPRVFFVPAGVDFSQALARGLRARVQAPEGLARVRLHLNTRRTGRAVTEALEAEGATWLPRIGFVGELAEEALLAGLPGGRGTMTRTLALMRLVEAFLRRNPGFGDLASAPSLAVSLQGLMDELQAAGARAEDLRALDLAEHARHWALTAEFLTILTEAWPAYIEQEEGGALDAEARRREAVRATAQRWAARPPVHPVIAAGSTASTPATAELLSTVAKAPQGAVVLPGWDPEIPHDVWQALTGDEPRPEHPHHHLAQFLKGLGLGPTDVRPWVAAEAPCPARRRLLTQALRPAPVTDAWLEGLSALTADAGPAAEGVAWLEAETPRDEAASIAAALAQEAARGGEAALVTPDKVLSRRVTAELTRWGIVPDDSAGRPLGLTPPGVLLGLVAGRIGRAMTAETLAAILRHPLAGAGERRGEHLGHLRRLERDGLRGGPREVAWETLEARVREARARRTAQDAESGFWEWVAWARGVTEPLAQAPADLADCAALHVATAEALAWGAWKGEGTLWDEEAGRDVRAFVDEFMAAAPAHGGALVPGGYGALWTALIKSATSRAGAWEADARVRILGALEARAETAGLMVLGGLNEGTWPAHPSPDPWLNRQTRERLGLASAERRIGLSAHDFLQAANAPRVVLSRAKRDDGGPTVPSRWLVRLENLLKGADPAALEGAKARGAALARAADALDAGAVLEPVRRPNPKPPVEARPRRLSVTRVETLIRDPYAIYAERVLGLRALEPLGRAPDARDMGMALHAAMEAFAARTGALGRDASVEALRAAAVEAAEVALRDLPWPALRRLWLKRLHRAADWLAQGEAERRAQGRIAAVEAKGARTWLGAPGGAFELTATADRIDALEDGGLAIFDYKSGSVPSKDQIGVFHLQLLLEAAIAEAGGFEGAPQEKVRWLEYLGLSGSGDGGKSQAADLAKNPAAEVWAQFGALAAAYDEPGQGYLSRMRPERMVWGGDYDQLARYGEWGEDEE